MLDPATLTLLRASIHRPGPSDGTFAVQHLGPFLTLTPEGWELHAYGRLQARWTAPEPLLYIMQREAEEAGWLIHALSAADSAEDALQPAAVRADRREAWERHAAAHHAAMLASQEAEWAARRLHLLDPSAINLDDL